MERKSVITVYRREKLTQITSGAISSIPKITHMAFGSGGTDENGEPIMPSETQTELNNLICTVEIEKVEYPISTTAKYTAVLPGGEYNGEKFNEVALVDEEGHFCAIENTYTKQKDDDLTMTWEIEDRF